MLDYYDKDGSPLDLETWLTKFEDNAYRQVALDKVGEVTVSTVWLGLNHQYGDGPPLIFETMIFEGDRDGDQWRDATEASALETHAHAMALVMETVSAQ